MKTILRLCFLSACTGIMFDLTLWAITAGRSALLVPLSVVCSAACFSVLLLEMAHEALNPTLD